MTPGRTGGAGTDGERPLEHSVMKRYSVHFKWTQWGCYVSFILVPHTWCIFYICTGCIAAFQGLFFFFFPFFKSTGKYYNIEGGTKLANLIFGSSEKHVTDALLHHLRVPDSQKGGDLHLFASQLTKKKKKLLARKAINAHQKQARPR